jgi:serine/threonine protein kinase
MLLDFGSATEASLPIFKRPKCGTAGYMAPEIVNLANNNETYTSKCDIFSAGCLMYKM